MTVTRCPQASQCATWPYRFVPVPPPCGWVQSRSVSSRTWRGISGDRSEPRRMSGACLQSSALVSARRRIAALLAVVAAGIAPGAALAQSGGAGDDQYGGPDGGKPPPAEGRRLALGPDRPLAGAHAVEPAAAERVGRPPGGAPAASSGQTLPRTGLD